MRMHNPPHPGKCLKASYLEPLDLSCNVVAKHIGVSASSVAKIVNGQHGITADMALKFQKAFGSSAEYWLNLQKNYDIWIASQKKGFDDFEPMHVPKEPSELIHSDEEE